MLDDKLKTCAVSIMETYETMVTNAYVDGLDDSISSLTRTSRPTSLYSAYQNALDQDNAYKRRKERTRKSNYMNPSNARYQPN